MTQTEIALEGCKPEPLMHYLKGIGVLRLVSEQLDHDARAFWQNEVLHLQTYRLTSRDELERFFLEEYQPSPIIAPWGARSGFFGRRAETAALKALAAIENSKEARFGRLRHAVQITRELLKELGMTDKPANSDKDRLMEACRARLPDDAVEWIDACYVLSEKGWAFAPFFGTGGNIGSQDLTSNFLTHLVTVLVEREFAAERLRLSLFSEESAPLVRGKSPGHFYPALVEGPNLSRGSKGQPLVNPWDFILALEGALAFATAASRRLSASEWRATFPFVVSLSFSGSSNISIADSRDKRPLEIWVPLWERPATYREVRHVLAEGRAELSGSPAKSGVEFARAIATLGVDRGIKEFVRYAFLTRSGKNTIAVPAGRWPVKEQPGAYLLGDLDKWLRQFRDFVKQGEYGTGSKLEGGSSGLRSAYRAIEDAIFEFCKRGDALARVNVLRTIGRAKRALARARSERAPRRLKLSHQWLSYAYDQSAEFRLATSLASLRDIGSYLEQQGEVSSSGSPQSVFWAEGRLTRNMVEILRRRILSAQAPSELCTPTSGLVPASLRDVYLFICGGVNDDLIGDLAWAFLSIEWKHDIDAGSIPWGYDSSFPATFPRLYALTKMNFLSTPFRWRNQVVTMEPDLEILMRLSGADIAGAARAAARRLRARGLPVLAEDLMVSVNQAERVAAALLFPVSYESTLTLARLILEGGLVEPS